MIKMLTDELTSEELLALVEQDPSLACQIEPPSNYHWCCGRADEETHPAVWELLFDCGCVEGFCDAAYFTLRNLERVLGWCSNCPRHGMRQSHIVTSRRLKP